MAHSHIDPAIFYWGTPVVLISTENEDGSANIGPMSSAFWLGDRCMLGLEATSKTTLNLLRTKQCVLNLASDNMSQAINALARTTGTENIPESKATLGYRYQKDKFGVAQLTPEPSELVSAPRIQQCPVQMEAQMEGQYELLGGWLLVIEVRVLRTYVTDDLRLAGHPDRIDPDAWHPMIMSFQHLYGLRVGKMGDSKLAAIEEELYRVPRAEGQIPESGPAGQ